MTKKKFAFLFPGQGAQYLGMAKGFYEQFAVARRTFEEANDILHRNLSKIVFDGPEDELIETRNSQTGIYVSSIAILRALQERIPTLKPAVCAGLSLGEYTALTASGRIDFTKGLELVDKRGQYMNDACEATKGTMAVIMGLDSQVIEEMVRELDMPHDLWAANFNCPLQVVISGTAQGVEAGMHAAKARGAKMIVPLRVHGAFHSGLMRYAEERLADHVTTAPLQESAVSFVMNVPGARVTDIEEIRHNLIKQVTSPVRWEQCIRAIESEGVDEYLEIGCGKVLAGFNRRIGTKAPTTNIEHVEQIAAVEKIIS